MITVREENYYGITIKLMADVTEFHEGCNGNMYFPSEPDTVDYDLYININGEEIKLDDCKDYKIPEDIDWTAIEEIIIDEYNNESRLNKFEKRMV